MAKQDDNHSTLTPRLRFPEFRGESGWNCERLANVAEFIGERVQVNVVAKSDYVSTENILADFAGIAPPSSFPATGSVTCFQKNDVLISNIRPYLKKVWRATRGGGASNDVIVIRSKTGLVKDYLSVLLKSDAFIDYVMKGAKGVKMPRGDIGMMREYPVAIPSPTEQRKIAECMGSLDALIAAERRKLEGLRAHKNALMQHLFPREGETCPRLRFPEFRDSAEWEETNAGDWFSNRKAKGETGLPMYSVTMHDGMVRRDSFDRDFYDIEDATGNKKACKGDIAYNMMRMWQGALGVAAEDCLVSPAYVVLAPETNTVPEFFAYWFKLPSALLLLTSHSRGLTKDRLRLYYEDFARIPMRCPGTAEQQRIAACLSALDAVLAGQSQKLSALKTHKQALMQQLFPAANTSQRLSAENAIGQQSARRITVGGTITPDGEPSGVPMQKPYQVGFARQLLAAEILHHCHKHPTMGRVKLQKLIHLCEYFAELDDIHGSYARAAAGPFDNTLMRGVAIGLEKQKWFKQVRSDSRASYEPMALSGQHSKYLTRWSDKLPRIHEIIHLFSKAKTLSCEIASTLYAAWNDLLLDGLTPTDAEIIREASDPKRWHASKAGIERKKWTTDLKWMREHGLVPRGYGAHTARRTR